VSAFTCILLETYYYIMHVRKLKSTKNYGMRYGIYFFMYFNTIAILKYKIMIYDLKCDTLESFVIIIINR